MVNTAGSLRDAYKRPQQLPNKIWKRWLKGCFKKCRKSLLFGTGCWKVALGMPRRINVRLMLKKSSFINFLHTQLFPVSWNIDLVHCTLIFKCSVLHWVGWRTLAHKEVDHFLRVVGIGLVVLGNNEALNLDRGRRHTAESPHPASSQAAGSDYISCSVLFLESSLFCWLREALVGRSRHM